MYNYHIGKPTNSTEWKVSNAGDSNPIVKEYNLMAKKVDFQTADLA